MSKAEDLVLGSCLTRQVDFEDVRKVLKPEHFSGDFERALFDAICQSTATNEKVNVRLVICRLELEIGPEDGGGALGVQIAAMMSRASGDDRPDPMKVVDLVLEAHRRRANGQGGHSYRDGEGNAVTTNVLLPFVDVTAWQGKPIPEQEWAIEGVLPKCQPAGMSGEGGVGKSLFMHQLVIAHVLGRDWLGMMPERGPGIYLNAEDFEPELHRRTHKIVSHYGARYAELRDFHLLTYAGKDALLATAEKNGLVKPTPLFKLLTEAAKDIRPQIIALDSAADIFGGDENNRSQVRQFIGMLRQLAEAANTSVLLAFHPSLTGISTDTGLSGSTHWHNGMRARLYLKTPGKDASERELQFRKIQYGPPIPSMTLRWSNGLFLPVPTASPLETMAAEAEADDLFLRLLQRFNQQKRPVSNIKGSNFAPTVFEGEPDAAGIKRQAFLASMTRLFRDKKIHIDVSGPPSRRRRTLMMGAAP